MARDILEIAVVEPAPSGFGLFQLTPWQSVGTCDADDFAVEGGYEVASLPGAAYDGLIQCQSDADGWLIHESGAYPVAYRYV